MVVAQVEHRDGGGGGPNTLCRRRVDNRGFWWAMKRSLLLPVEGRGPVGVAGIGEGGATCLVVGGGAVARLVVEEEAQTIR